MTPLKRPGRGRIWLPRVPLAAGSAALLGAGALGLLLCLPPPQAAAGRAAEPEHPPHDPGPPAAAEPLAADSCLRLDVGAGRHCDKDGRKVRVVGR